MRITKVKWSNHPILKDLELNFVNTATGQPFDTILFAGENGTGKTTILEKISTFLNRGSFEGFAYREYIVSGNTYRAVPMPGEHNKNFHNRVDTTTGVSTPIRSNKSNNAATIDADNLDIRHYGCIFSKARADYKTEKINHTTTKTLDTDKYDVDSEDDFTSLKQLIVDVEHQDHSEYANVNKSLGSNPMPWGSFYLSSKIYRFKKAFDNFFDLLKYDRVHDRQGEKSIVFNKNSQSISIDRLSTGEKQIVFRGIYLLKNNQQLDGATIMIDEPELSMHPKWQRKILNYYKELFTDSGRQKTQLFIATHSEHVLKEAIANKDENLVIVLKDTTGVISAHRIDTPGVLPSITSAETNYLAFDIVSNDYHIELYGWLQDKEAKSSVKSCDDFIKTHTLFSPSIHGRVSQNPKGVNYETLSTYIRNAIHHPSPASTFTEEELRTSIELLIELCR